MRAHHCVFLFISGNHKTFNPSGMCLTLVEPLTANCEMRAGLDHRYQHINGGQSPNGNAQISPAFGTRQTEEVNVGNNAKGPFLMPRTNKI